MVHFSLAVTKALMQGHWSVVVGKQVIKFDSKTCQPIDHYRSISEAAKANKLSYSSVRGNANHQLHLNKDYYFEFAQGKQLKEEN